MPGQKFRRGPKFRLTPAAKGVCVVNSYDVIS